MIEDKAERFSDLPIGAVFEFESVKHPFSGIARGPWCKMGARKYARTDKPAEHILIGTTAARVYRVTEGDNAK